MVSITGPTDDNSFSALTDKISAIIDSPLVV